MELMEPGVWHLALLELGVIGFGLVTLVLVIGGLLLVGVRLTRRDVRNHPPEETAMMQGMYAGLARMEERVEALETILLDRAELRVASKEYRITSKE